MSESRLYSFAKSVSWRFFGTAISWVATFYVTGSVEISTNVSILEVVSKTILFYCHERIWQYPAFSRMMQRAEGMVRR